MITILPTEEIEGGCAILEIVQEMGGKKGKKSKCCKKYKKKGKMCKKCPRLEIA